MTMFTKLSKMKQDEGFTLVELLVVIAILGILAGIVVFSVSKIGDKGQAAACSTEKATLISAEEANYAKNGVWAKNAAALQTAGFLATPTSWYDLALAGTSYAITVKPLGTTAGCK
jgi:prepilin-type N-terminal cleavage/methylation domain-containing protein